MTKFDTLKLIRKNLNFAIAERYNSTEEEYNFLKLDLIFQNKNCRLNSAYVDVVMNFNDENLKRFE